MSSHLLAPPGDSAFPRGQSSGSGVASAVPAQVGEGRLQRCPRRRKLLAPSLTQTFLRCCASVCPPWRCHPTGFFGKPGQARSRSHLNFRFLRPLWLPFSGSLADVLSGSLPVDRQLGLGAGQREKRVVMQSRWGS